MPSAVETNENAAFAELIDACVAAIVRDEDWQRFSCFLEETLRAGRLPQFPAEPAAARMLACALGRAVWNATPLPGSGFRPRPIPAPGRNDPCLVGPGCKHKHCCCGAPAFPRVSSDEIWVSLCKALPAAALRAAASAGKVPAVALGAAARRMVAGGDPEAAKRLLEPLFGGDLESLDERHEEALDALCDAWCTKAARSRGRCADRDDAYGCTAERQARGRRGGQRLGDPARADAARRRANSASVRLGLREWT